MYDFKSIIPRRNTDSVKWDVKSNELPMWVADMDFKAAPEIIDAMQKKVAFGIFGYEEPHADYFNAVADGTLPNITPGPKRRGCYSVQVSSHLFHQRFVVSVTSVITLLSKHRFIIFSTIQLLITAVTFYQATCFMILPTTNTALIGRIWKPSWLNR